MQHTNLPHQSVLPKIDYGKSTEPERSMQTHNDAWHLASTESKKIGRIAN
jgi:hypothetical protein